MNGKLMLYQNRAEFYNIERKVNAVPEQSCIL